MKKQNKHVGSSLDDFLKEEGILEETRTIAIKEAIAWQVQRAMEKDNITKVEMARRMHTSRAALDRLLDPATPPSRCRHSRARPMPSDEAFASSSFSVEFSNPFSTYDERYHAYLFHAFACHQFL